MFAIWIPSAEVPAFAGRRRVREYCVGAVALEGPQYDRFFLPDSRSQYPVGFSRSGAGVCKQVGGVAGFGSGGVGLVRADLSLGLVDHRGFVDSFWTRVVSDGFAGRFFGGDSGVDGGCLERGSFSPGAGFERISGGILGLGGRGGCRLGN